MIPVLLHWDTCQHSLCSTPLYFLTSEWEEAFQIKVEVLKHEKKYQKQHIYKFTYWMLEA